MQSADDVKFRGAFADAFLRALIDFLKSKIVCAGGVGIAAESAEFAMCDADVGGIDVAIDVVIGEVAVALLANVVGEPAYGEKIGRAVEGDAVINGQTHTGQNFVGDWPQSRVGDG